jgi:hypothetical protein
MASMETPALRTPSDNAASPCRAVRRLHRPRGCHCPTYTARAHQMQTRQGDHPRFSSTPAMPGQHKHKSSHQLRRRHQSSSTQMGSRTALPRDTTLRHRRMAYLKTTASSSTPIPYRNQRLPRHSPLHRRFQYRLSFWSVVLVMRLRSDRHHQPKNGRIFPTARVPLKSCDHPPYPGHQAYPRYQVQAHPTFQTSQGGDLALPRML